MRNNPADRDDEVVFGLQLVAEREDKAHGVLLALTDQVHPADMGRAMSCGAND